MSNFLIGIQLFCIANLSVTIRFPPVLKSSNFLKVAATLSLIISECLTSPIWPLMRTSCMSIFVVNFASIFNLRVLARPPVYNYFWFRAAFIQGFGNLQLVGMPSMELIFISCRESLLKSIAL